MKIVFLDRDNTLNIDIKGYLSKVEDVVLMPDVVKGLTALRDCGYQFVVVTNQSGIGRGMFTMEDFHAVTCALDQLLANQGIELVGTLACPHTPEFECDCRKPGTGLFEMFERHTKFDKENSWMVGDRDTDVQAGEAFGIRSIKIGTPAHPTLKEVAHTILTQSLRDELARLTNQELEDLNNDTGTA